MASHLSFTDRENLLDTIRKLSGEVVDVDFLLKKTGDWARALEPQFGFEQALLRNLTQLAYYLRLHQAAEDIASIAKGAIQFIVTNHGQPSPMDIDSNGDAIVEDTTRDRGEFLALGQAFIASYAVHEIAFRLGKPVAYHPPSITQEEQKLAEVIFEELSLIDGCDATLIGRVIENLEQLKHLADCGFLKRLAANAKTLIDVLQEESHSADEKAYVRGALRYFVKADDAINDDFGIIGYLDDLFILQMAVDLVSPHREPLIELLDQVVGVWPFLNMLTLDDGVGPRAASEFTILNSALSCRTLRSNATLNTMLVTPETGPIAILLGFVSTLGLAHEAGIRQLTEKSFAPGQKVLVDYEAVAEFDGFEDVDGRRLFWLQKYNTTRGVTTRSRTSWPIADLHRLVPVNRDRVVRGEIRRGKRNEITELSGLCFLFNGPVKADVHAIKKRVIVVMPTTVAAEFCKSTLLYGQPIKDVIPIGQISADGEDTEGWSTRFGSQLPVLLFASDLDSACSYAQEYRDDIELIVVDVSGRNLEKHASIKRLNRMKIPCLLVATERAANDTGVDQHNDLSVWEWSQDDLKALIWPDPQIASGAGEIGRFEKRVRATASAKPIVESISLPIVDKTYNTFLVLRRLAKRRGVDGLPELEEIVAEAFYAITLLMRCSTAIDEESNYFREVHRHLGNIASLIESSSFLSQDEQTAAAATGECVRGFLESLRESNPKATALLEAVAKYPAADILCADARLISELEKEYSGKQNRVFASAAASESFENGLIVTGWFKQGRMASVLSPPVADPVVLLLYDVERRWHSQFSEQRRTMREARTRVKGRASIFPTMRGWKKPSLLPEVLEDIETEADNIAEVQVEIDEGVRQRIYDRIGSSESDADTKARLLLFEGGVYGLFTDNYKLNVVTHLLEATGDGSDDDEKARVKLSAAKDVIVGDRIVFRPKSRDLIREVADELMPPGLRETSALWKKALRAYINENSLTDDAVCSNLREVGCKAGDQAIRNWINDDEMIAPQQFRTDVPAIARITGDQELARNLDAVIDAIKEVRSAHQQKAPRVIAKRIRKQALELFRQEQADESIVQLEGDLVLVRVAEKASKPVPVKYASTNRLVAGHSWHE